VSSRRDPITYLDALPIEAIGEIHLAGHHAAENVNALTEHAEYFDAGAPA
jgi:uncharacterized protein